MAEIEKDETGVAANRPTGPGVVVRGSADEQIAAAPAPSDKAKKSYRVLYPTDNFVVEGLPVVTSEGTPLTDEQFKKVETAAHDAGVRIVEVER